MSYHAVGAINLCEGFPAGYVYTEKYGCISADVASREGIPISVQDLPDYQPPPTGTSPTPTVEGGTTPVTTAAAGATSRTTWALLGLGLLAVTAALIASERMQRA